MSTSPILFMTAGLMLTVSSAQSEYRFDAGTASLAIPRWLPYAVLGALAAASAVVGVMFPEMMSANVD
jgi:hypothetical protein